MVFGGESRWLWDCYHHDMATRFMLPSDDDGSLVMGTVITVAMRFVLPTDDDGASKNPTIRQKNIIKIKK